MLLSTIYSLVETIFIEISLKSKKWLLSCSYNPNLTLVNNHIQNISRGLDFYLSKYDNFIVVEDFYSSKYDNFIVLGDFNAETSNATISEFCATYNLKYLIKEPTCCKNLENLICIDLILTNSSKYFQNSNVFETGLSDFYKLTFTVLKAYFQKQKPNCLANSIILPPELFLSSRNGTLKHFNANWLEGKDGSFFVSETSKMFNLSWTISRSILNLFLKEFIFKWPMINLSTLFNQTRSRILRLLPDSLLLVDWRLNSVILWETLSQLFGLQQKLSRDHQFLLKVFTLLMKLMASLPYPVLFRCNPLLFKQFPPMSLLSTTSIFKASRWSFTILTFKEAFPLSDW